MSAFLIPKNKVITTIHRHSVTSEWGHALFSPKLRTASVEHSKRWLLYSAFCRLVQFFANHVQDLGFRIAAASRENYETFSKSRRTSFWIAVFLCDRWQAVCLSACQFFNICVWGWCELSFLEVFLKFVFVNFGMERNMWERGEKMRPAASVILMIFFLQSKFFRCFLIVLNLEQWQRNIKLFGFYNKVKVVNKIISNV